MRKDLVHGLSLVFEERALSKTREPLKVSQKKLPDSQVGLEIEISSERSREAYEQTINRFMKSAQIPGFRRGKVPRQVVLQRFGASQLKAATLEDLVEKTFKEAIEQEKIDALGNFQLQSSFDELVTQFEPGTTITYNASIDIPPEASLQRYTNFQLQAEEVKYDATQVDRVIDEQRAARATLVPVEDRAAAAGDVVLVDFTGKYFLDEDHKESQEIEGGSAEDFQLELNEGQFIPGFIEGIIGMTAADSKELEVQFPEEYFQEDLAGKTAVFNITLKEIKAKELPEVDDDFVQEVSEFKTVAELRQFLEERYRKEAQDKTDTNVETALLNALVAELAVELPETLVADEVSFLINQMAQRLQAQGIDVKKLFTSETIPNLKERFRDEAIERVKRTLALAEVAKAESITLETEALEKRFRELITQVSERDIDRDRLKEVIADELLQEKVIAWLKEHSEITLVDKLEPEPESESAASSASATSSSAVDETSDTEDTGTTAVKKPAAKTEKPEKAPKAASKSKTKASGEVAEDPAPSPEVKAPSEAEAVAEEPKPARRSRTKAKSTDGNAE
jgi:trigger factor